MIRPINTFSPAVIQPPRRVQQAKDTLTFSRLFLLSGAKQIDDDIHNLFHMLPKADLHEHQGGSTSPKTFTTAYLTRKYAGEHVPEFFPPPEKFKDLPEPESFEWDALQRHFRFTLEKKLDKDGRLIVLTPESLKDYTDSGLDAFRAATGKIGPYTKNVPFAYDAAYEFARDVANEHVRFAEYRVSGSGNQWAEYKEGQEAELFYWVNMGFKHAQAVLTKNKRKFDYGLIMLLERNGSVDKALRLVDQFIDLKRRDIVDIAGIDLAGGETSAPVTLFEAAFEKIHAYNRSLPPSQAHRKIGITIHAGETAKSETSDGRHKLTGPESIREAVRIGWRKETPFRIGHGVQLVNSSQILQEAFEAFKMDPDGWQKKYPRSRILANSPLLREIIEKGIVLEMCPKSNGQSYAVHPFLTGRKYDPAHNPADYTHKAYRNHPGVFLSRLGVKVAISSDNRTTTNSDITNEFVKLYKYSNLTYDDLKRMTEAGIDGAFIFDPQKKAEIKAEMMKKFRQIERDPDYVLSIYKLKHHGYAPNRFQYLMMVVWAYARKNAQDLWDFMGRWFKRGVEAQSPT